MGRTIDTSEANDPTWAEEITIAWERFNEVYPTLGGASTKPLARLLGDPWSKRNERSKYVNPHNPQVREAIRMIAQSPHYKTLFKILEIKNGKPYKHPND